MCKSKITQLVKSIKLNKKLKGRYLFVNKLKLIQNMRFSYLFINSYNPSF